MDDTLIVKCAAELVEELLEEVRNPTGQAWYFMVERKMKRLLKLIKKRRP